MSEDLKLGETKGCGGGGCGGGLKNGVGRGKDLGGLAAGMRGAEAVIALGQGGGGRGAGGGHRTLQKPAVVGCTFSALVFGFGVRLRHDTHPSADVATGHGTTKQATKFPCKGFVRFVEK